METVERSFTSGDGAELFYRAWIPNNETNKALLLFHRGHEHSGRWLETVDSLDLEDVAIFAWDARGHGRSAGDRGAAKSLHDVIKDVDIFARHVSEKFDIPVANMIVLAHSLAAVTVTAWVHDYAPPIPRDDFGHGRVSREALCSIRYSVAARSSTAICKKLREIKNAYARS